MSRVVWKNIRGPRAISATVIATALGSGLLPLAPGTWGTILALPLAYASMDWAWPARVALWSFLLVIGTWAASTFDEINGTGDNQSIVIDEVVGLGITAWTAGPDWKSWIAAFVLFRFFDVVKPPPIRQIDRWSKRKAEAARKNENSASLSLVERHWGGFGVMADDVLAGFEALLVMIVLQTLGVIG